MSVLGDVAFYLGWLVCLGAAINETFLRRNYEAGRSYLTVSMLFLLLVRT